MPTPSTIFVIVIIALVSVGTLGMVLLKTAEWLAFHRAGVNSSGDDMSSDEAWDDEWERGEPVVATTPATQQQPIAMEQKERNALLLQAKAEALAAMVEAGAITETKGLQIVFGVRPSSTNPRYIEARAALHTELAKRRTPIAGRPTPAKFASGPR